MLILPIGDENPTSRQPVVNWTLIGLNVCCFLVSAQIGLGAVFADLAITPGDFRPHTLVTSMFLHGGLAHLLGNMLFLWIVGDNVEDKLGRVWYPVFYAGCGIAAGLTHVLFHHGDMTPTIGASGAVAGTLGMYAVLFPDHQIKIFYWFYFWLGVWYVSAKWAIGFWFAEQFVMTAMLAARGGPTGVAYGAHVGGFLAGAVLGFVLRRRLLGMGPARPGPRLAPRRAAFAPVPEGLDAQGRPYYGTEAPAPRAIPRGPAWSPGTGWAVLVTEERAMAEPARLVEAIAAATGTAPADAAAQATRTPGMVARGMAEEDARAAVHAMARAGVGAAARPDAELRPLPPMLEVARAVFFDQGFEVETEAGFVRADYPEVTLLVAGRVQRTAGGYATVLTAFLQDAPRLCFIEGDTIAKLARPGWGVAAGMPVRGMAVALANRAAQAGRNLGVEILIGGARSADWTGLTFDGFAAYEAYCAWAYQVRAR